MNYEADILFEILWDLILWENTILVRLGYLKYKNKRIGKRKLVADDFIFPEKFPFDVIPVMLLLND